MASIVANYLQSVHVSPHLSDDEFDYGREDNRAVGTSPENRPR